MKKVIIQNLSEEEIKSMINNITLQDINKYIIMKYVENEINIKF